ncbi:hypothetical protein KZZ52_00325 [Dactylosporangium sp. AC04546]|uniref:hypothetical protein n=1 Tax=Dactylosporangium sp. AC04546 TaxID=2862460 RepID=UPI001EE06845|nr:hypothetical protein [Dactylosporangium sp. AC04546]WVK83936.1 hypothetical protein KZZ52_00325 [Dactylosporangium sp. AC04546]
MGAALIGACIALVAGVYAGSASTRAKRARLDYRRTKALVPAARKTAWAESLRGLKVIASAGAVLIALAMVMNVIGQR